VGPRTDLDAVQKRKSLVTKLIELHFLSRRASLVTIMREPSHAGRANFQETEISENWAHMKDINKRSAERMPCNPRRLSNVGLSAYNTGAG
jgi:hypothetical protein